MIWVVYAFHVAIDPPVSLHLPISLFSLSYYCLVGRASSSSAMSALLLQDLQLQRAMERPPVLLLIIILIVGVGDALLSVEKKFMAGEAVAAQRAIEREMEAAARPVPMGSWLLW
jgi:hypothetical protein